MSTAGQASAGGLQDRLKRRRIDSTSFPPNHLQLEKLTTEDCGACLLPLVDNTEAGYNPEDDLVLIGQPDICGHLFHPNCIKFWARRDTSCPQCRLRFSQLGMYRTNGVLIDVRHVKQVFLSDTLEQEEEGDESFYYYEEEDSPLPDSSGGDPAPADYNVDAAMADSVATSTRYNGIEASLRARRQRRRPQEGQQVSEETDAPAAPRRRRAREQDAVAQVIEGRITRALLRMREQLAVERRRELLEAERIRENIDTEMVKLTVLRNLKRLPYNFALPEGESLGDSGLHARSQPDSVEGSRAPRRRVSSLTRARVDAYERISREQQAANARVLGENPAGGESPPTSSLPPRCQSQDAPSLTLSPPVPPRLPTLTTSAGPSAEQDSKASSSVASSPFISSYDNERRQRIVVPSATPAANATWGSQFSRLRRPPRYESDFLVTPQNVSESGQASCDGGKSVAASKDASS